MAPRRKQLMNILGMLCGAFGELLNATVDSITKLSKLNGSQLLFGRYLFQIIVSVIWWNVLKRNRYQNQSEPELGNWYGNKPYITIIWLYGTLKFIDNLLFWYGIRFVPIGISYCIMAAGDVLTFYIGYVYFKEPLFKTFPISVLLRVISLFLLLQQPRALFEYILHDTTISPSQLRVSGLILVTIASVTWSLSNLLLNATVEIDEETDEEREGAHFLQLQITNAVQNLVFWIPFVMIFNTLTVNDTFIGRIDTIDAEWDYSLYSLSIVVLIGVVGFGANVLNIFAYQLADASKVIWSENVDVICAYVYQIAVFHDSPNVVEICGAILMVMAAFLPLFEELNGYCAKGPYHRVAITSDSEFITDVDIDAIII
eukprot:161652_1